MKVNSKSVKTLLGKYEEISLLGKIGAVLGYDTNVSLPEKGSEGRALQSAYIAKLVSDKWHDVEFKKIIKSLDETKLNDTEKAIVRNIKHAGNFYFNVPQETIIEFSKATSSAFMVWQKARNENNFKDFQPHLEKLVTLSIQIAECLGYEDNRYDALLNIYEPGLTTNKFQKIVDIIQPALTTLLRQIEKSNIKTKEIQGEYSISDQERITLFILQKMGYDLKAGRQDISAHPFTETLGNSDVRITNRYKKDSFIESIMVAMHEGGHALYEQGVLDEYSQTPLEGGISLGIHESQSRFWENQIGRSREFAEYIEPILKAYFPKELQNVSVDNLYQLFNKVQAGLIRVEADEVSYNLHIALRFEIEQGLINEKVAVKDLPEVWNEKMKKYLGVTPDSDANGCMQDVHWSYGSFGYFPTYTLGNLYAAQFTNSLSKDVELSDLVLLGDFDPILDWWREKLHKHGSRYLPNELCTQITGEDLNPQYFLDYIKKKYTKLYKLVA